METTKYVLGVAAALAGAGWAFFQFVWVQHLGPALVPASLSVTTTTRLVGCHDDHAIFEVSVRIKNASKSEATIVLGDHQAVGTTITRATIEEQRDAQVLSRLAEQYPSDNPQNVSRFVRSVAPEYFNYRPLPLALPTSLGPDEETLSEFLLYVPAGRYDVVRIGTHVHAVRDASGLTAELVSSTGTASTSPDNEAVQPRFYDEGAPIMGRTDRRLTSRRYHRTIGYKTVALWDEGGPVCGQADAGHRHADQGRAPDTTTKTLIAREGT